MKTLMITLSLILAAGAAHADEFAYEATSDCINTNGGTPKTHLLVRFVDSLAGELDPNVLGDGGLLIFANPFTNEQTAILETDERAPFAHSLKRYAQQGLLVTIKKSCLKPVSAAQARAMNGLKSQALRIKGTASAYRI